MTGSDRIDLAHEPDFTIGRLTVLPSRRELTGDAGQREVIEHRVMQVLIALSRAEGRIVTRAELTQSCWDGRVVGDDSIHRALSRLRKIAKGIGAGSIEIETIPKIGYRLTSHGQGEDRVDGLRLGAPAASRLRRIGKHRILAGAAALILLLAAGLAAWAFVGRRAVPLVAVGAADSSAPSQALARDLLVKLGTLPQVGAGNWQLVQARPAGSRPNLLFRTAATRQGKELRSTLMLLDGANGRILWSREFNFPANRESDLRHHVSLTAARALGCALEARSDGGLPPGFLRMFLTGCAAMAETSEQDPQKSAVMMRAIVDRRPHFAPAWARLLMLDGTIFSLAVNEGRDVTELRKRLRDDIEWARRIAPDLLEIKLAQLELLPPTKYAEAIALVDTLKAQAPERPEVWIAEAVTLSRVGRMHESAESARRAAELDPLSPAALSKWITFLAWSGETDTARKQLQLAERLWHGTGALRDAQFAFHLRYGDPRVARSLTSAAGYLGDWSDPYLQARLDPSAANIDRLMRILERRKAEVRLALLAYAVQALGEFHRTDEVFEWLLHYPPEVIANLSYILFRPSLAEVRRDTRFMQVARRIGLAEYWNRSGQWPDFCREPGLPYDCRQEAGKPKS
ncbi:MAG TPA: winged helix-turn-helix domain-containing protein [Sphingomicrobium sp.]|nr:winged helix-turn-helix domain-containing protein [Sphingomicrobium sp.]